MKTFLSDNTWIVVVSLIWVIPWKGYALWTASQKGHKRWFIALLIVNSFAILDIIYVFFIAKKTQKDILHGLKSKI